MTREDTLKQALDAVTIRGEKYGDPEDCFNTIARLWSVYKEDNYTAKDVAIMMILLKIARESNDHKDDNCVDIAGYAACCNERK